MKQRKKSFRHFNFEHLVHSIIRCALNLNICSKLSLSLSHYNAGSILIQLLDILS